VPRTTLAVLLVTLLTPAGAHAADGAVALYLQPVPPAFARFGFAVAAVVALGADGSEQALDVRLRDARAADLRGQRLLASARLPAGSYTGFTIRLAAAGTTPGGALLLPDAPMRLDFRFTVARRQGMLVWLTLDYEPEGGSAFRPVFSAAVPERPIPDHLGFVTSTASGTITIFDRQRAQAVALLDACAGPAGMALDQRRRRAFVACMRDDEILAIDVATGEVAERARTSPGDRPRELALTPDGRTLISVNTGSDTISFFDAGSLTVEERIPVGSGPRSIAMDPSGRRAFVFNTLSATISVVEVAARGVASTLSTDSAPLRGAFSRRGDRLYVIHERLPSLTVLDAGQLTTVARARLRSGASAIAVDAVRDLVCLGSSHDMAIECYDSNALLPLYSLRVRGGVSFMTTATEDNALYIVSPDRRALVIARLADRKVLSEVDVGEAPGWAAVMGER
jgi:YVTN family beta-propeller protein